MRHGRTSMRPYPEAPLSQPICVRVRHPRQETGRYGVCYACSAASDPPGPQARFTCRYTYQINNATIIAAMG